MRLGHIAVDGDADAHQVGGPVQATAAHCGLGQEASEAQWDAMCSVARAQSPVSLERACCAVLLGDTRRAAQLLGLAPASAATAACDPDVKAFVVVSSFLVQGTKWHKSGGPRAYGRTRIPLPAGALQVA